MIPANKIVLLAMDAGDKNLIQEWTMDGTLPIIRSVLARGLVGDTRSVEGLYEGSTWPSFCTGVNPGRHGFHRLTQIEPGTYDFRPRYPGEFIKREPFWNRLSRAGRRVAILDVPLTGISEGLNGIQTVEWGSHDFAGGFQTWPRELRTEVLRRFGSHPSGTCCDSHGMSARDFGRLKGRLVEGVGKKAELTLHFLQKGGWDFFAQVFHEAHCAGHQCWHLHDPSHPNHDPDMVSLTGDPIREVYRAIDGAIGEILSGVDDKTLVVFLATHRMAHHVGLDFLLEDILEKLDVLERLPTRATAEQLSLRRISRVARGGWERLPDSVQAALKPVLSPLYHSAGRQLGGEDAPRLDSRIDLKRCKCFPHQNGSLVSGIRVNLLGREPAGLIAPGNQLDDFCRLLSDDLLDIVDRASGKPIATRVVRTSDLFQGEYIDHLPDLLVEWNEDIRMGSKAVRDDASCRMQVSSDRIGLVEGEYAYCRTGGHRAGGLFTVFGPGIQPGNVGRTVSIMDFAPTILHWFGLPSDDLDGKEIAEIPWIGDHAS